LACLAVEMGRYDKQISSRPGVQSAPKESYERLTSSGMPDRFNDELVNINDRICGILAPRWVVTLDKQVNPEN